MPERDDHLLASQFRGFVEAFADQFKADRGPDRTHDRVNGCSDDGDLHATPAGKFGKPRVEMNVYCRRRGLGSGFGALHSLRYSIGDHKRVFDVDWNTSYSQCRFPRVWAGRSVGVRFARFTTALFLLLAISSGLLRKNTGLPGPSANSKAKIFRSKAAHIRPRSREQQHSSYRAGAS